MTARGQATRNPLVVGVRRQPRAEHFVTAHYGIYSFEEEAWVPSSEQHLKMLGVSWTECGLSTVNWQVFWLHDPAHKNVCAECRKAVWQRIAHRASRSES